MHAQQAERFNSRICTTIISKSSAGIANTRYHNPRWSEPSSGDDESIVSVTAIQAIPIG
jgi:hypothetical protein